MRNDRVLKLVLYVAHDSKCFFALCILEFNQQLSHNFILSQKCQYGGSGLILYDGSDVKL